MSKYECSVRRYLLLFHTILIAGITGLPPAGKSVSVDTSKLQSLRELESYEEIEMGIGIEIESTESRPTSEAENLFDRLYLQFSCDSRATGFYADSTFDCRIFHVCDENGQGYPIICPGDSSFDQRQRVCTDEPSIECRDASDWFHLNELAEDSLEMTGRTFGETGEDLEEDEIPTVLPLLPI